MASILVLHHNGLQRMAGKTQKCGISTQSYTSKYADLQLVIFLNMNSPAALVKILKAIIQEPVFKKALHWLIPL